MVEVGISRGDALDMGYRALSRLIYRYRVVEYERRQWELFVASMCHTPQSRDAANRQHNAAKKALRDMRRNINILKESLRRRGIL